MHRLSFCAWVVGRGFQRPRSLPARLETRQERSHGALCVGALRHPLEQLRTEQLVTCLGKFLRSQRNQSGIQALQMSSASLHQQKIIRRADEMKSGSHCVQDRCRRYNCVRLSRDVLLKAVQKGYERTCRPQKASLYLVELVIYLLGSIHNFRQRLVKRRRRAGRHVRTGVRLPQRG